MKSFKSFFTHSLFSAPSVLTSNAMKGNDLVRDVAIGSKKTFSTLVFCLSAIEQIRIDGTIKSQSLIRIDDFVGSRKYFQIAFIDFIGVGLSSGIEWKANNHIQAIPLPTTTKRQRERLVTTLSAPGCLPLEVSITLQLWMDGSDHLQFEINEINLKLVY